MTGAVTVLLICVAGGIGAALRLLLDGLIRARITFSYPVATTVINLSGSLVLGLLTGLATGQLLPHQWQLIVGTGLLAVRTIDRTEELYSDRVEVQVALASDVSANDTDCSQPICQGLMTTLKNSPLVDSVRFESQQQAYERYLQLFKGQSLAEVVRPQSLPATLRVKLTDPEAGAQAVREAMIGQVGVRNVIDQRDVVAKLFDFLSASSTHPRDDLAEWLKGNCIVVNLEPRFSPRPSQRLLAALRREFPLGQQIGRFEVRWR